MLPYIDSEDTKGLLRLAVGVLLLIAVVGFAAAIDYQLTGFEHLDKLGWVIAPK